jgi:hypothetical protein
MRHLQTLHEKYGGKGLVILGFNSADKKDVALELLRQNSATFPNIIDSSKPGQTTCFDRYKSSGVPLSYIIDKSGKVVDAWYGYEKGHPRALRSLRKLGIVPSGPKRAK